MVIFTFPVLWEGWECDSVAWIMEEPEGTRWLKMTNHGEEYKANLEELNDRIAEYERVIAETRKAIDLLAEKQNES